MMTVTCYSRYSCLKGLGGARGSPSCPKPLLNRPSMLPNWGQGLISHLFPDCVEDVDPPRFQRRRGVSKRCAENASTSISALDMHLFTWSARADGFRQKPEPNPRTLSDTAAASSMCFKKTRRRTQGGKNRRSPHALQADVVASGRVQGFEPLGTRWHIDSHPPETETEPPCPTIGGASPGPSLIPVVGMPRLPWDEGLEGDAVAAATAC